jgi:uncharacterized LabA/DUF88 family protein
MKTAVLVDADFYLRQRRRFFSQDRSDDPSQGADDLWTHCIKHVDRDRGHRLYRIFVYDCPPLSKKVHHPQTGRPIDLSQTATAQFRRNFHERLKAKRNVALRLGYLDERNAKWKLRNGDTEMQVLKGKMSVADLSEGDFTYHAIQKGVDMKIGLDIAAMTLKRLVDRVVLIAGDSDFVPAAKFARREGVEFTLDPMHKPIRADLQEHIDGLDTTLPNRRKEE